MSTELEIALVTVITADSQRGGGNAIDTRVHPKAIGTMGLAPFDVEMTAVVASQKTIDEYLKQFPESERGRIKAEVFKSREEMDRIRTAGLVF